MEVTAKGAIHLTGTLNPVSDRNAKENIQPVQPERIEEKIPEIPVSRWLYKNDLDQTEHIGPMAQDFHAAFSVGSDEKRISTTDADGVSLAAIQALYQLVQKRRDQLDAQQREIESPREDIERFRK